MAARTPTLVSAKASTSISSSTGESLHEKNTVRRTEDFRDPGAPPPCSLPLLGAFASGETLARADASMNAAGYRTHEFGDSVLIERADHRTACNYVPCCIYGEKIRRWRDLFAFNP